MSNKTSSCYIYSDDSSLLNVYLPDSTEIFVGRSPETNITDTKCSRSQVRLYADYAQQIVTVQQIGSRACGFNGFKTRKDVKFVAKHNDCLEILYSKYRYKIEFNPPPKQNCNNIVPKKRFYDSDDELVDVNSTSRKVLKTETKDNDNDNENKNIQHKMTFDNAKIIDKSSMSTSTDAVQTPEDNETAVTKINQWESIDNGKLLIYSTTGLKNQRKIAAFDMDGTLIKTKSGLIFPKSFDDWQLLYPSVPKKLKQLYDDGYKIVVFTNQGGLGTGKVNISDFKHKIEKVMQALNVPIQVFIATGKGIYRKPVPGMWDALVNNKNEEVDIDKTDSFFVGDAAGRQTNWCPGRKKDFSAADRFLALNIGIRFHTPEEFFLAERKAPYIFPVFKPKELPKDGNICEPSTAKLTSNEQEVILMIGSPGSGKSHFVKSYLTEYEYVNRDTLGSWQKCVSSMEQFLNSGKSVVIDNTNPECTSRQRYIEAAKKRDIPIRCFLMSTSIEHAKHNNKFREIVDPNHAKIGDMIINSYMKNYVPPKLEEGFTEIIKINFIPKFFTEKDKLLYEMYLLDH